MSAAGNRDPDVDSHTVPWPFGEAAPAIGLAGSRTCARGGPDAWLHILRCSHQLADTITSTAEVSNVAPVIGEFAGSMLLPGETYTAPGSFTDPGADPWTATVDYGDGSGTGALVLSGKTFSLSHTYAAAGTFMVTVRVSDDDATAARTAVVTVLTPAEGAARAIAL